MNYTLSKLTYFEQLVFQVGIVGTCCIWSCQFFRILYPLLEENRTWLDLLMIAIFISSAISASTTSSSIFSAFSSYSYPLCSSPSVPFPCSFSFSTSSTKATLTLLFPIIVPSNTLAARCASSRPCTYMIVRSGYAKSMRVAILKPGAIAKSSNNSITSCRVSDGE